MKKIILLMLIYSFSDVQAGVKLSPHKYKSPCSGASLIDYVPFFKPSVANADFFKVNINEKHPSIIKLETNADKSVTLITKSEWERSNQYNILVKPNARGNVSGLEVEPYIKGVFKRTSANNKDAVKMFEEYEYNNGECTVKQSGYIQNNRKVMVYDKAACESLVSAAEKLMRDCGEGVKALDLAAEKIRSDFDKNNIEYRPELSNFGPDASRIPQTILKGNYPLNTSGVGHVLAACSRHSSLSEISKRIDSPKQEEDAGTTKSAKD